ncbi:MAG: DUF4255 domain-containing protein [Boseongicola sp.]
MSYRSINAITRSITTLLQDRLAADATLRPFFDAGVGGNMDVSPRSPEEMDDGDQSGLSVWLYQIRRDPELLNLPPRRISADQIEPERLPLRLHYLMTPVVNFDDAVGNDPGLEQLIIGKVLQTHYDHPHLTGPDLLGDLAGSDSTITIRLESLGLEEITRVWDALSSTYQLCISYEVSFVMVCSDAPEVAITPVDSVEIASGTIVEVAEP